MKNVKGLDFNKGSLKIARRPISAEEIEASKTKRGAWVASTVRSWGVPFPPPKGWLAAIKKYGVPLFDGDQMRSLGLKDRPPTPSKPKKKTAVSKPEGNARARQEAKAAFYKSWEWRTLRMETLKKHGPICMCCGAEKGDLTIGGELVKICVDHIKPLATHWHLRLDPTNLQILCDECNQGKGAWDETDWRVKQIVDVQLKYTI